MKIAAFVSPLSFWRRLVAGFLLGVILGVVGTIVFTGKRLEKLIYENEQLSGELNNEKIRVEQLLESLKERRKRVVTSLKLEIDSPRTIYKSFFEEYIHGLLADLVGMEIARVEPKLIWNIINNREVKVREEFFRLSAQWVLVKEEVEIGVKVQPVGDSHSE